MCIYSLVQTERPRQSKAHETNLFGDVGLGVNSATEQTTMANVPSVGERYIKGIRLSV